MNYQDIIEKINAGHYKVAYVDFDERKEPEFQEILNLNSKIRELKQSLENKKKESFRKHDQAEEEALEQFKKDCLSAVDLTDHPKAEQSWNMAWDKGHSSGYTDILLELMDLAELLL